MQPWYLRMLGRPALTLKPGAHLDKTWIQRVPVTLAAIHQHLRVQLVATHEDRWSLETALSVFISIHVNFPCFTAPYEGFKQLVWTTMTGSRMCIVIRIMEGASVLWHYCAGLHVVLVCVSSCRWQCLQCLTRFLRIKMFDKFYSLREI